ncbi:MAG: hypothetical protein OHK0013_09710 [Sandaracinaceae bacterium]
MTSRFHGSTRVRASFAALAVALVASACGARTTLDLYQDGAPPRLDAGPPVRTDAGLDAGPIGCTTDRDCPDDGLMCNGFSYCDPLSRTCQIATPEPCDDGVDCTVDRCVERAGCVFEPDPRRCGPGETCEPFVGCVGGCSPIADVEIRCRDGADDDCDGLFDCGDPDCRRSVECSMCAPAELDCVNAFDEDCDGLFDCADPDCAGRPECGMGCVPTALFEWSCFDGVDNDCNGLFDCGDPACTLDPSCGMCVAFTEVNCTDGRDDDCDFAPDCMDFDCAGRPECGGCVPVADREIFCGDRRDDDCDGLPDCADPDCARDPACGACMPVAMSEVRCTDGRDDDCDGLLDCADRDCAGNPSCGGCVPTSRTEIRCRDGLDDDCDGRIDCDDSDCRARPICMSMCTPTAPNELGVDACTNALDDDCDGRPDCADPDCSPFGPMGECCDGRDNNGDGNVDEFTCRCFDDAACVGVGSLDQTCWEETFSICAPRCNLYGGDRFCRDGFGLDRCDRRTGECL